MHRSAILSGGTTSNGHGNSPFTISNHLVTQPIAITSKIQQTAA
jgi:hypothetical protein